MHTIRRFHSKIDCKKQPKFIRVIVALSSQNSLHLQNLAHISHYAHTHQPTIMHSVCVSCESSKFFYISCLSSECNSLISSCMHYANLFFFLVFLSLQNILVTCKFNFALICLANQKCKLYIRLTPKWCFHARLKNKTPIKAILMSHSGVSVTTKKVSLDYSFLRYTYDDVFDLSNSLAVTRIRSYLAITPH